MDRSPSQKVNKEMVALNDTLDKMELINIFRALHLKISEYTFFLSAHRIFYKTDHMLGHKTGQ